MLTPRQQDKDFPRENLRRSLWCVVIPFFVGAFFPFVGWFRGILAIVGGLGGYLLAGALERRALIHYRCPNCKAHIGHDTAGWRQGLPIVFLCPQCKMEWDTGLRSGPPRGVPADD